jgi:hypothetical protein
MPKKKVLQVKPCPFCGKHGPDVWAKGPPFLGSMHDTTWVVECHTCGVVLTRGLPKRRGQYKTFETSEARNRAGVRRVVRAWNRRAPAAREGGET